VTAPLLVVDAPSLMYRAFFALPSSITDGDGHPVNALLGTTNLILFVVERHAPRAVVLCWGAEKAAYRAELYAPYHADRPPMPDDLERQWRDAPGFFDAFGWTSLSDAELEADDLLGSLARVEEQAGGEALLFTGDRDMFQCVSDRVRVLFPRGGKDGPEEIGPAEVRERYGVEPAQVPDFIALRGDPSDGLPGASQLVGDRDSDLSALATGDWDATIDVCAYFPRQVRSLLETLGDRAGHFTFVSTISVYGNHVPESGFTEETGLLPPEWSDDATMEKYGELKVACEQVAAELTGGAFLNIRPGYVVGPYDYTERFTHWIREVAAGKPFVAPAHDQPLQCVDGRDLGEFTVKCVEDGVTGDFNVTAPQEAPTFAVVLETIARALAVELPEVTWADPTDVSEELPLSAGPDWWAKMRADLSKATAAGFSWRPLEDTVRDTAAFAGL